MLSKVTKQIRFNDLTRIDFPYYTKIYWLRSPMVDQVLDWATSSRVTGIYLMEALNGLSKITPTMDLLSAFAFRSEEEFGLFNLIFYDKLNQAQNLTNVYKLWITITNIKERIQKKL